MAADRDDEHDDRPGEELANSFFLDGLSVAPGAAPGRAPVPLPADTPTHRFIREIGRGGMGVVFEAEDLEARRRVAVKLVHPGMALSPEMRLRFQREARAAAGIHHDRVVFVYGAHEIAGVPAISMELMSGETLADRIADGQPVEPIAALAWIEDVLAGLEVVHERGLVHRDIKPANVFLDDSGRAKLGDFGLTRPESADLSLTASGIFVGSPLFCSPEQARGRELDARSDIYSVGATLYALLTGSAPFPASNIGDLIARITSEEPRPPREVAPGIPIGLDEIVLRAMSKDPAARFRSAREMRIALSPFQPGGQSNAALGLRVAAFMTDILLISFMTGVSGIVVRLAAPGHPASDLILRFGAPAVFLFYFGLFERFGGATPGKLAFGLRVVRPGGGRPSGGAAFLRAAFFLIDDAFALAVPALAEFGSLNVLLLFSTARRRNGFRGIHEFASGTRTVALRSRVRKLLEQASTWDPRRGEDPRLTADPAGHEIIAHVTETSAGEVVLALDRRLDRKVWLVPTAAIAARAPGRADLRWLGRVDRLEVYEDPGGASLSEYAGARRVLEWLALRELMLGLVDLVEESPGITADRIWIDRRGRARCLPFTLRDAPRSAGADPVEVLATAVTALTGGAHRQWIDDLPEGGSNFIKRARGDRQRFDSGAELNAALLALGEPGERPSRVQRFAHAFFGFIILVIAIAVGVLLVLFRLRDRDEIQVDGSALAGSLAAYALLVALPNAGLAAWLRGGPLLSLLNLRLFDRGGERVSAARAAVRALVVHAPGLVAGGITALSGEAIPFVAPLAILVIFLAALADFVFSMIVPARSLADLVTRTHLVHVEPEDQTGR
ncbi:MAG: protein kinase [Planctomycetota bacterium]